MVAEPQHYEATLESVRRHPLPDWYQDAKLGIFVRWRQRGDELIVRLPAPVPDQPVDVLAMPVPT